MASLAGTRYSGSRIKILFGMIVYMRCAEMFMEQSMLPALLMSDSLKGNNGNAFFLNIFSADKRRAEKKVGLTDRRECGVANMT